jgi:hypothetical protein
MLGGWSPLIPTGGLYWWGFGGPVGPHFIRPPISSILNPYRTITFFGEAFHALKGFEYRRASKVRVRSPLLTESRLISFFFGYLDVSVGQEFCQSL